MKLAVVLMLFLNVYAKNFAVNYEDEIDPVIDMLLNMDYDSVLDSNDNEMVKANKVDAPIYSDGLWKCGNCSNINDSNLIYTEKYLISDYDMYTEKGNMELQVGLSLQDMRCVVLKTDEESDVNNVNGACDGGPVTLSVVNSVNCIVSVYS